MRFALDGGVWLHRHKIDNEPMVHLVSSDQERLLELGRTLGFQARWLQYKPLKDPDTGIRVPAWHWDVWGEKLNLLKPTYSLLLLLRGGVPVLRATSSTGRRCA